ncbi:hypothetical protein ACLQ24_25950 [Micromonospora sp. DT4]|uniref:hypothetical protein n=1 Tax=Micromonospora sp. DT4 TaxID=3393438 RepID=UPI003CECD630
MVRVEPEPTGQLGRSTALITPSSRRSKLRYSSGAQLAHRHGYDVLLDAAAFAATNRLDLRRPTRLRLSELVKALRLPDRRRCPAGAP